MSYGAHSWSYWFDVDDAPTLPSPRRGVGAVQPVVHMSINKNVLFKVNFMFRPPLQLVVVWLDFQTDIFCFYIRIAIVIIFCLFSLLEIKTDWLIDWLTVMRLQQSIAWNSTTGISQHCFENWTRRTCREIVPDHGRDVDPQGEGAGPGNNNNNNNNNNTLTSKAP